MTVKPLTEHHFEFLSLQGGCTGSSEPIHIVCATIKASDQPAQTDQSLCLSLEYSMSFQLLTEQHLELLSL